MRRLRAVAAVVLGLALAGCASLPIQPRGPLATEAAYTALYPYYLEFCALSEVQKWPGHGADIRGGIGGHSTIYLNGVCRKGEGYPNLVLCAGEDTSDGVGLSVNAHFANANWAAIPGRDFFYHGDLKPGQALTPAVYEATKAHAKRLGIYDAIRFHRRVFEDMPPGTQPDAYKYEVSIATDYAVGYGRDRYCARTPVTKLQMMRIAEYLNAINQPYREGRAEYEWSVLTDNCIHLAHNALSVAGFWFPWATHRFVLIAAFDFPVPKNEFVNILRRANDEPVGDLLAVWHDAAARRAVLAGDGLPTRDGALALLEPAVQTNALYRVTDLQLIFYDDRLFGSYEERYRRIATEPRYSDLRANLQHFAALDASILAARRPLDWWLAHPSLAADPDFPAFYTDYYDAVARRAAFIAAALGAAPRT